jgi:LacI family transcriptional regulator
MSVDKGPTTIKDVAQLAGVSPATVSLVINGSKRISAKTVARVNEAIEKLNFRPNSIARSLRKSHTLTTGIINHEIENISPFLMSLMIGVEEAAREQGFSVFLCNSDGTLAREKSYLETLIDKQINGIIFVNSKPQPRSAPALDMGSLPYVFLYQYAPGVPVPSVMPDDRAGGYKATHYLSELGHRRIGYINGDQSYQASTRRFEGYRQALQDAGLSFDSSLVQLPNTWFEEGGYHSAKVLMQLPEPPTAVFCANDELAVGALEAVKELGLRVPNDVSLVGYDDRPEAAHKRPPLTTVALPFYEMGKLALNLLLAAIRGEDVEPGIHYVQCPLIERSSCAAISSRRQHVAQTRKGGEKALFHPRHRHVRVERLRSSLWTTQLHLPLLPTLPSKTTSGCRGSRQTARSPSRTTSKNAKRPAGWITSSKLQARWTVHTPDSSSTTPIFSRLWRGPRTR